MNRTWTDEQEQYLVAHYATTSNAELAEALGKKNADKHTDADGSGFMRNYNVKQIISDKK